MSVRRYRLSRVDYDRAVEAGAFEPDAKLELIDGDLRAMTREETLHSTGMNLVADCLRQAFDADFHVQLRNPLAADDYSEPEPDVTVVTGALRDYRNAHPTWAVPIIEVSNESLRHDRTVKQPLYARCAIPEYRILTLPDARLEIHRDPAEDGYRTITTHAAGERVAPLARPDARIAVGDLLP